MRVPTRINPQTEPVAARQPYLQGQGADWSGLAREVQGIAGDLHTDQLKREEFDVNNRTMREVNDAALLYETRKGEQPLGAPNFAETFNSELETRHRDMLTELRDQNYSPEVLNLAEQRWGNLRSAYFGKALGYQQESVVAKGDNDYTEMAKQGSVQTFTNPDYAETVVGELEESSKLLYPDAVTANEKFQVGKRTVIESGRRSLVQNKPQFILNTYGVPVIALGSFSLEGAPGALASGLSSGGLSAPVVAGFLGNAEYEAGFDSNRVGDNGSAFGHMQWRKERVDNFKRIIGKDPKGSSVEDATKFILWEMQNPEAAGMTVEQRDQILNATTAEQAAELIDKFYERSDGKSRSERKAAAAKYMGASVPVAAVPPTPKTPEAPSKPIVAGNLPLEVTQKVNNPDGSVSTVRTISVGIDGKEVLIPTVVDGKVVSDIEAVDHYRVTGENFGTFNTTEEADAYGEWLHQKHMHDLGKTGNYILDNLSGEEVAQTIDQARNQIQQQSAVAARAQQAAHSDVVNQLQVEILDGKAGQREIDALRESGVLTDYDEIKRLQDQVVARDKEQADINRFNTMMGTPGFTWNPFDPDQRKSVEAAVKAAGGTTREGMTTGFQIWQKTGILAQSTANGLRGAMISLNPGEVIAGATLASNMLTQNPNALAGVQGREDIEKVASSFGHYVNDLGYTAEQASQRIAQMNDPKNQHALTPATKTAFIADLKKVEVEDTLGEKYDTVFTAQPTFLSSSQRVAAVNDYSDLAMDHYQQYGDPGAAKAWALGQMQKLYGVVNGRLMKFPPTKGYPPIGGSHDYIFHQAQQDIKEVTGLDVPVDKIFFTPLPGTAEEFRAGKPPRYAVRYIDEVGGVPTEHLLTGKAFTADPQREARAVGASRQVQFDEERLQSQRVPTLAQIKARNPQAPNESGWSYQQRLGGILQKQMTELHDRQQRGTPAVAAQRAQSAAVEKDAKRAEWFARYPKKPSESQAQYEARNPW